MAQNGAGDRSRTHDLLITSQLLYQLSYTGKFWKWWRMTGSNRRPPACKAGALPAELILQHISEATSYSHRGNPPTTIGAKELNFRVRHGNGCDLFAIVTSLAVNSESLTSRCILFLRTRFILSHLKYKSILFLKLFYKKIFYYNNNIYSD